MYTDLGGTEILELSDKEVKVTLIKKIEEKWKISSEKRWESWRGYEVLVMFDIFICVIITWVLMIKIYQVVYQTEHLRFVDVCYTF